MPLAVVIKEGFSVEFDAVVVGGGPAGSTVGGFLTRMGRRVLILEKLREVADGNNSRDFVSELLSDGVLVGCDS